MFQTAGAVNQSLSAIDKSQFSVLSIDVANLFAGSTQLGSLTFVGNLFGGGTVMQTFNFNLSPTAPPVFSTLFFNADFANLTSLDFAPQGPSYQFGNVRIEVATSVAPEPASLLLLSTGLVVVAIVAARRRRAYCLSEGENLLR